VIGLVFKALIRLKAPPSLKFGKVAQRARRVKRMLSLVKNQVSKIDEIGYESFEVIVIIHSDSCNCTLTKGRLAGISSDSGAFFFGLPHKLDSRGGGMLICGLRIKTLLHQITTCEVTGKLVGVLYDC
jgi:hypothetical protein